MLRDPDVARWNPAPDVIDLESARAWCERGGDWSTGAHATFSVLDDERLVGNVSVFALDHATAVASIGYRVAPWARRRGVATAAVATVTAWAFESLAVVRMQLFHAVANVASCRVAGATGFALEGVLRGAGLDGDGIRHDEHVHARLAGD